MFAPAAISSFFEELEKIAVIGDVVDLVEMGQGLANTSKHRKKGDSVLAAVARQANKRQAVAWGLEREHAKMNLDRLDRKGWRHMFGGSIRDAGAAVRDTAKGKLPFFDGSVEGMKRKKDWIHSRRVAEMSKGQRAKHVARALAKNPKGQAAALALAALTGAGVGRASKD